MTNIYYVYQYVREDGTPYYIGKGKGRRAYAKHNVNLPKNKERIILLQRNLTEEQSHNLEKELIAKYGRKDVGTGILHNKTDGGEGMSGWEPTDETKRKISESKIGSVPWNKGKIGVYSEETIAKMGNARKGKTPWNKGNKTPKKPYVPKQKEPRVFTDEHRAKLSAARKGKHLSEEYKKNMSLSRIGKTRKPYKSKQITE